MKNLILLFVILMFNLACGKVCEGDFVTFGDICVHLNGYNISENEIHKTIELTTDMGTEYFQGNIKEVYEKYFDYDINLYFKDVCVSVGNRKVDGYNIIDIQKCIGIETGRKMDICVTYYNNCLYRNTFIHEVMHAVEIFAVGKSESETEIEHHTKGVYYGDDSLVGIIEQKINYMMGCED
jgi:hypothetical protein